MAKHTSTLTTTPVHKTHIHTLTPTLRHLSQKQMFDLIIFFIWWGANSGFGVKLESRKEKSVSHSQSK